MKSRESWIKVLIAVLMLALALGCDQKTPTSESISLEPTSTVVPTQLPTHLPIQATAPTPTPPPTSTSTPSSTLTPTPSPTATRPPTPTPTPLPTRQSIKSIGDVKIDTTYGTIDAQFAGSTDDLIILIGENHASYKVQKNVAHIVEGLLSKYDIGLLLLEGYGETIDTSFFDAIPDAVVRREVALAFLEIHEISGAEYAALVSGPGVETMGVENMDLWQQSKEAIDNEPDLDDPAVQQTWNNLIDEIIALIDQLEYTTELDKIVADFLDEKIDLQELYDYLLETAAEESISTTALEAAYQELQEVLNPVLKFATAREPYMVENSLAMMEQYDTDVAILVVGHAHFLGAQEEGGLSALLQDKGISYLYLLPHGTEEETTDEENQYYEDQLNEIPSAFEAWLNQLFKPKPSIVRTNHRAEIEVVGKVAYVDSLDQAGRSWTEITVDHADWLRGGKIHVQDRFSLSADLNIYSCRARGEKGNETFTLTVSSSDSEPRISHKSDLVARWQVGDQWVSVVKGRSADILIRRGIVARNSEPGRMFAYVYEVDGGEGIAWQVGGTEVVIPNISWDTLSILLDPEMPIEGRDEKIKTALGGGASEPPFGGDNGPIILFPDDPDYMPDSEGEESYDQGRYFHPSYEDNWLLDWPALAILLKKQSPRLVYNDGNPLLAKENLSRQEPVHANNIGVVVNEASLDEQQKEYTRQIPDAIDDAGVNPDTVYISFSLDDFPPTSNVLMITAENDQELEQTLSRLGKAGVLTDKYVVVFTCGDEGLRDFAQWFVQEYGLTGLHVFRDKIHANTLPHIVRELFQLAKEEPGLMPAELVDRAIKHALKNALDEQMKHNLNRLQNGWDQLSRHLDPKKRDAQLLQPCWGLV